jgi:hypothetical protein
MRLRPRPRPLPRSGSHTWPAVAALALRPSREESVVSSSLLLASSPASSICQQRFACKFVGGDDKDTARFGVDNVDDAQVPSAPRLTDGDPRTVKTRSVLPGRPQHVLGFRFCDAVSTQMCEAGVRVPVEAESHLRAPNQRRGALPVSSLMPSRVNPICPTSQARMKAKPARGSRIVSLRLAEAVRTSRRRRPVHGSAEDGKDGVGKDERPRPRGRTGAAEANVEARLRNQGDRHRHNLGRGQPRPAAFRPGSPRAADPAHPPELTRRENPDSLDLP